MSDAGNKDKVAIYIPKDLYKRIEKELKKVEGFRNVDEYVTFILSGIFQEEYEENVYSFEEEERIKERLKSLGYL